MHRQASREYWGPLKYILGLSVYPEEILLALSGTISELDVKDQSDI